jgi:GNAT superfamily N-acetyltransferase
VLLRPATPADVDDVARVHVRSWQAGYRGLIADEVLDALRPEDRAAAYTFGSGDPADPLTVVAVDDAEDDGETICGLVTIVAGDTAVGEVRALYADPARWDTGVGRALIADARHRLRAAGHTTAELWVLAGNTRADRFYRRDGWAPTGETRSAVVWGIVVEEVGYRRTLP